MGLSSNSYADEDEFGALDKLWAWLSIGFALVLTGLVIIFVASMLSEGVGNGSIGGVIFIGPIPIVFGAGLNMYWLIAISVAISVLSIIVFIIMNKRVRRE